MQEYQGNTFFDGFTFYAGVDPTNGYVNYVNQSYANATGLINTSDTSIYMSADSTNVANEYGRKSVRVETKATFNGGLFILSLNHILILDIHLNASGITYYINSITFR